MKLVDKSKFTGKDRKKTLELVQRCNALADESKCLVRCRALLQGWGQERPEVLSGRPDRDCATFRRSRSTRGGANDSLLRPACQGDARRARGRPAPPGTQGKRSKRRVPDQGDRRNSRSAGLLSGETTLRANVWRFATGQNEACRQEQIDREGPEKDARACPEVQRPRGRVKKFGAVPRASSRLGTRKTRGAVGEAGSGFCDLPSVEKYSRGRK